jgi:AcrR family transcriptional regulator
MPKKKALEEEKIAHFAIELFAEKGYAATSIRDIAHSLKVSSSLLYYYFKNKEELLFTILEAIGEELLHTIDKEKNKAGDPLEVLRGMIMSHIRLVEKENKRAKLFVEQQHNLTKKYLEIIYGQHRNIYDLYVDQLKKLREAGMISNDSLSVTAFAIIGMIMWSYRWYRKGGGLSVEDMGNQLIETFFYGIVKNAEQGSGIFNEDAKRSRLVEIGVPGG